jgi:hypothetical protein
MRIGQIASLAAVLFIMGGCQTYYKPPAEGIPTSKMMFDMSFDNGFGLGTARVQEYRFVNGTDFCEQGDLMAGSLKKSTDGLDVEAGKKLTITSIAAAYTGTGTGLNTGTCVNLSSFTPLPGKTYEISQNTIEGLGCTVNVKDTATDETPSDFFSYSHDEMDKINEDCGKNK